MPAQVIRLRLSADGSTISMHEFIKRTIVASAFGLAIVGSAVHILDAGHFALCEKPDEIAKLVGDFLGRTLSQPAELEQ
jgi:pimeloyl-ACP methyl ester carboxylesterase